MLQSRLSEEEIQKLKQYRLALRDKGDSVAYASLADPEKLPDFLMWLTRRINATNACVASSMLIKRMAFYAVLQLYAMTALEKKLIVDVKELKLVDLSCDELWLPDFYLGNVIAERPGADRKAWRADVLRSLFAHCLTPLVLLLKEQTRLSERVMWENISIYIHWLYGKLMEESEHKNRIKEDYDFIFYQADGELFGQYETNPLAPFSREDGETRITCCLSYMLRSQKRSTCSICPLGSFEK